MTIADDKIQCPMCGTIALPDVLPVLPCPPPSGQTHRQQREHAARLLTKEQRLAARAALRTSERLDRGDPDWLWWVRRSESIQAGDRLRRICPDVKTYLASV